MREVAAINVYPPGGLTLRDSDTAGFQMRVEVGYFHSLFVLTWLRTQYDSQNQQPFGASYWSRLSIIDHEPYTSHIDLRTPLHHLLYTAATLSHRTPESDQVTRTLLTTNSHGVAPIHTTIPVSRTATTPQWLIQPVELNSLRRASSYTAVLAICETGCGVGL